MNNNNQHMKGGCAMHADTLQGAIARNQSGQMELAKMIAMLPSVTLKREAAAALCADLLADLRASTVRFQVKR